MRFWRRRICPSTTPASRRRPRRPRTFIGGRRVAAALDRAFQLEETRVLSNDWVIRYDTRYFQVARQSHQAPARSTVLVREAVTGAIEIRYRGRLMRWTEIPAPPPRPPLTPPAARAAAGGRRIGRPAERGSPVAPRLRRATAAGRRAGLAPDRGLWTPAQRADAFRTAPTAPWARSFGTKAATGGRGHFYFAKNGDISISR